MGIKVSVVTVCYNSEKEIEETLQSVLNQKFFEFEYVIKDGNSIDKTNRIIELYKEKFSNKNIKLEHIISEDKGIYDAMNQALKYCSGEWVIFMNSGDKFYNNLVLYDVFCGREWNDVDIIYGHTLMKVAKNYGIIINHDNRYLSKGWSMNHQSMFERRRLLREFPFDIQYKIVADYDHLLRISNECKFGKCNVIISVMNRDGVSNTHIALRNNENEGLRVRYNLNWKKKLVCISWVKEYVRKIFPFLEIICYVKNSMKRTLSFMDEEMNEKNNEKCRYKRESDL